MRGYQHCHVAWFEFALLAELVQMQAWELARALRNLPHDLVMYKTIAAFKDQALAYLDKISMGKRVS